MTTPAERRRAIGSAYDFLRDLLDKKTTPGVPKIYRERAYRILRHYPITDLLFESSSIKKSTATKEELEGLPED